MTFKFTRRIIDSNGVLVLTLWEGNLFCSVSAFNKEDQTKENIDAVMSNMIKHAKRPGAPRNGKRLAVKC